MWRKLSKALSSMLASLFVYLCLGSVLYITILLQLLLDVYKAFQIRAITMLNTKLGPIGHKNKMVLAMMLNVLGCQIMAYQKIPQRRFHKMPMWLIWIFQMEAPKTAKYHDMLDRWNPGTKKNLYQNWFLTGHGLTSTKPCITLMQMRNPGLCAMAKGTNKFKKDDVAMAVPKIKFAGYFAAKKPPGTCVTK